VVFSAQLLVELFDVSEDGGWRALLHDESTGVLQPLVELGSVHTTAGEEDGVRGSVLWAKHKGIFGRLELLFEAWVAVWLWCLHDGGLREACSCGCHDCAGPSLQSTGKGVIVWLGLHFVFDVLGEAILQAWEDGGQGLL
jgi:hypothetical protein